MLLGKWDMKQAITRDQNSNLALIIATTLEDFILIVVKGYDLICITPIRNCLVKNEHRGRAYRRLVALL